MGQEKLRGPVVGLRPKVQHPILPNSLLPLIPPGSYLSGLGATPRVSGVKRREGKVSLACSLCRKARKKCNGGRPCSACLSLKKPGACIFDLDSDRRRKCTVKKMLENVQQRQNHLQDIFNYLRDSDAKSAAALHAKIRQGLTMDELVECVTQKEEINAGAGAFAETEASTAPLLLQLPSLGEAATVPISSKKDWELALPIENMSIENMPAITRTCPLTQAGMILYFPTFTEVIANPKLMERRMSILRAAIDGDEALMDSLLGEDDSHLSFTNAYSRTPLSLAAENGHEGVVRQMLKRNDTAINRADLDGQTALAWAASNGRSAVVRLLLEQDDLDANSKDIDGNTPLSWAATNGYDTVVALLLERYDVAVSTVNNYGRTPLSLATGNGYECIARRLSLWDGGLSPATIKHYAT